MEKAKAGKEKLEFTPPTGIVLATVNRLTGQRVPSEITGDQYIKEVFREGTVPNFYETGNVIGEQLSVIPLTHDEINPVGARRPHQNNESIGSGTGGLY
jgi:membrane carboxypeptidase/penicillin-binding protein